MAAIVISLSHFSPLLLLLCFTHFFSILSSTEAQSFGFTADLIHRDSLLSPFYNPSTTNSDRLTAAFHRSLSRATNLLKRKPTSNLPSSSFIQSQIIPTSGAYLMKLSIGFHPFEILAYADTGSDLTWTQCKPCKDCFHENSPLFNPKKSRTYRTLPCQSKPCKTLGSEYASCSSGRYSNDNDTCRFNLIYGDMSYSNGDLAVDVFTFGTPPFVQTSIPNMVFGCSHDTQGSFTNTTSGIIGLGGGNLSLIHQLSDLSNGKFSYCLVPLEKIQNTNATSTIKFGSSAVVSGSQVVSTPIVTKPPDTFYYLTLKDITVGNRTHKLITELTSTNAVEEEGNIIIDSGTTLTFLPIRLYKKLESELKKSIKKKPVKAPSVPLSLCYKLANNIHHLPNITLHFSGGADLELPPTSTFVKYDDVVCLAMMSQDDHLAIFGNLSQMNFLIGFDLVKKKVSFKPTDCTKH